MINHIVCCNHSKGQESYDGRTGDVPGIPSTISRFPHTTPVGCLVKAGSRSGEHQYRRRGKDHKEEKAMSINELEMKCRELRQLQALIDEAQAEAEAIKDAIKAAMGDSEAIQAGEYKVTWKPVTSSRLDATALRKALPDVAERFTRTTTVRRFTVA